MDFLEWDEVDGIVADTGVEEIGVLDVVTLEEAQVDGIVAPAAVEDSV